MTFVAAVCPQCSGTLQIPPERDFVKCEYCGTDIMIREPVRPAHYVQLGQPAQTAPANGAHLKRLAEAAIAAGNYEEACDYFNRALEIDPDDVEAWLGKADALGLSCQPGNLRLQEMIVALESARRAAAPERQADLLKGLIAKIKAVVFPLYTAAYEALQMNPSSSTWESYLRQGVQYIAAGKIAHELAPDDTEIIQLMIEVCRGTIEGAYANGSSTEFYAVDDAYEKKLRETMEAFSEKLAVFKPGYQYPMVQRAGKKCFVVTATMGDAAHPSVVLLRVFRDERLARFSVGRAFIGWYWTHGPALARRVEKSKALRSAAYVFVVVPAVALVKALNRLVPR